MEERCSQPGKLHTPHHQNQTENHVTKHAVCHSLPELSCCPSVVPLCARDTTETPHNPFVRVMLEHSHWLSGCEAH